MHHSDPKFLSFKKLTEIRKPIKAKHQREIQKVDSKDPTYKNKKLRAYIKATMRGASYKASKELQEQIFYFFFLFQILNATLVKWKRTCLFYLEKHFLVFCSITVPNRKKCSFSVSLLYMKYSFQHISQRAGTPLL